MPARDIVDLAEDMIDTLVGEGVDLELAWETTEVSLALYLIPTFASMLGSSRNSQDAQVAARTTVDQIRIRHQTVGSYSESSEVIHSPEVNPNNMILEGIHFSTCLNCSLDSSVRVEACDVEGCNCFGESGRVIVADQVADRPTIARPTRFEREDPI